MNIENYARITESFGVSVAILLCNELSVDINGFYEVNEPVVATHVDTTVNPDEVFLPLARSLFLSFTSLYF